MQRVGPQTFAVGVRGQVEFRAYDPDGDRLVWRATIPGLANLENRLHLAGMSDLAVLTFTPIAHDVGEHRLDVSVTDGRAMDLQSVLITVRPGEQKEGLPRFLRPLGAGTTFYVDVSPCIEIDVEVEDVDSLIVTILQDPPIESSQLIQQGDKSALFSWCPSEVQKATKRHVLHLVADDHDNPPVRINDGQGYFIMLETAQ